MVESDSEAMRFSFYIDNRSATQRYSASVYRGIVRFVYVLLMSRSFSHSLQENTVRFLCGMGTQNHLPRAPRMLNFCSGEQERSLVHSSVLFWWMRYQPNHHSENWRCDGGTKVNENADPVDLESLASTEGASNLAQAFRCSLGTRTTASVEEWMSKYFHGGRDWG